MQVQLGFSFFVGLLCACAAWAAGPDEEGIKKLFTKYEGMISSSSPVAPKEVFTEQFLKEEGGERAFAEKVKSQKAPKEKYALDIKPGRTDKNLAFVKMVPEGKKEKPDSAFIVRRQPSGEWRIEGTIGDDQ